MKSLKRILIINFILGVALRAILIGWLLILFGLAELLVRGLFLKANLKYLTWLDWKKSSHRYLWIGSQLTYLLASLMAVDFGDTGAYAFLHLWEKPPDQLIYLYAGLGSVNLLFTIAIMIKNCPERRGKKA